MVIQKIGLATAAEKKVYHAGRVEVPAAGG
jgi:hypothetical protein